MESVSIRQHERNLRDLKCAVSRMTPVTLHHCHGGSIKSSGWHVGMGQKQNPFLQIPLHAMYHIGDWGIDSGVGVESWEKTWGRQWDHLIWVNNQLGYNIFAEAVKWEETNRRKSQPSTSTRKSTGKE
jgi:hypothetical protein